MKINFFINFFAALKKMAAQRVAKQAMRFSILVCCLAGCGGGGGGGGTESVSGSARTGVRILHGALDAVPLVARDATAEGTDPRLNVRFAEQSFFGEVETGQRTISVSRSNAVTAPFASFPVTISEGDHYTLLIYGNEEVFGLKAALFKDEAMEFGSGEGGVRLYNGVVGAASLDLQIGGQSISTPVTFGGRSEDVKLPAGVHSLQIRRHADQRLIYSSSISIPEKGAVSLLVTGEIGYLVLLRQFDE